MKSPLTKTPSSGRPPLIANRFEIVIMISLCFIIATRLVWLQIDDRNRMITDDFFATAVQFNRSLAPYCHNGVESNFPYSSRLTDHSLDADATTSPVLELSFFSICQWRKLGVDAMINLAPFLIGFSAFMTALVMRVMTSSWVGGMCAASVVLSRGSILQGTHLAGTAWLLHPIVGMIFLCLGLFTKTRDSRLLPVLFVLMVTAVYTSAIMALVFWPIGLLLGYQMTQQSRMTALGAHRARSSLISLGSTLFVIPISVLILRAYDPSSTRSFADFVHVVENRWLHHSLWDAVVGFSAIFWQQDVHWRCSVLVLLMMIVGFRHLTVGSATWMASLLLAIFIAMVIDGTFVGAQGPHFAEYRSLIQNHMAAAIFPLEPLVIGSAAGYLWQAVRQLMITFFPRYIVRSSQHDMIK